MFFWHLVSTFLNLNRCIQGAFLKFRDLELKFCMCLCIEVNWGSKVTVLGISIWFFPDLQEHNEKNKSLCEQDLEQENKALLILILVSMVTSLICLELVIWVKIPSLPKTKISLEIPSWDPLMEKWKQIQKPFNFYIPRIGVVGCIDPECLEFNVIWMD